MGKNEYGAIEVLGKNGMSPSKGGGNIQLSPEASQQLCIEMISLGAQLISETGKITVDYFRTQSAMYYDELRAYIDIQTLRSNERQMILSVFEQTTNKYMELIDQADNGEEREALLKTYERLSDVQGKLYLEALKADNTGVGRPEKPNLFQGIKNLFSNI